MVSAAPSIRRSCGSRGNGRIRSSAQGKTVKIVCVGKKGYDQLRRQFEKEIIEFIELRAVRTLGFENADAIARKIIARFDGQRIRRRNPVLLAFPFGHRPDPDGPAAHSGAYRGAGDAAASQAAYEYEPGEDAILASLLPRNIAVQVFRALLENAASEQGARMSAMDNATRNAGDMIRKQTMQYNRSRQAMITKELIEIISGAEAL